MIFTETHNVLQNLIFEVLDHIHSYMCVKKLNVVTTEIK